MRKFFYKSLSVSAFALLCAATAHADVYQYVGNWAVDSGPSWGSNPTVYSGQTAAVLLFGAITGDTNANDYAISTAGSSVANINFSTWLDGWGDPTTYAYSGTPASQSYSLDTGGSGYNSNPGGGSAYSAYVADHSVRLINYAFLDVTLQGANQVPEPESFALVGLGLAGLGFMRRKAKKA